MLYPVGSIYISVSSTNPSELFGGTWISFGEGRTLLGTGSVTANTTTSFGTVTAGSFNHASAEVKGGEYTHTLTVAEIPNHTHSTTHPIELYALRSQLSSSNASIPFHDFSNQTSVNSSGFIGSDRLEDGNIVNKVGGGGAHNIMQPYITVYMWKRTA